MLVNDILLALKDLAFASFREPSLLWQLAPVLVLWGILIVYFATHKKEQLGWNTSLTNGITLFWVVMGTMQHIFSNNKEFFTWTKFSLFVFVSFYAMFIIYVSFKHSFRAKTTYLIASQNPVLYFSMLVLLYAHDMIYFTLAMLIAIVLFFLLVLLLEWILMKILPEMEEELTEGMTESFDDYDPSEKKTDETDDIFGSSDTSSGIEDSMGKNNFSDSDIDF